jgi:septal ring factor EnvC (AmiA/AmiB activator)
MVADSISFHHHKIIDRPGRSDGRRRWPIHKFFSLLLFLLLPGLVWTAISAQAAPAPDQPLEMQEAELKATEARLIELRARLDDREAYREALYTELERNERDIAALARSGHALAQRHDDQQKLVAELGELLAKRRAELEAARGALAALLRAAYVAGPGDRLRLLLNQQDPARAGRQLGFTRAVARLRATRVADVERLTAELDRLRFQAEQESERLAKLAAQERQTQQALKAALDARRAVLADLDTAIADDRERVADLDANAAALRKLVEELRQRARIADEIALTQEAITSRRGKLPRPITQARLAKPYRGSARPGDLHADGVVFAAPPGSEVFPVHHGQVVYADWLRGFGLLLVIDHGDGYMSLYGHNQALLKEVGEWVGPDDVVALSGSASGTDIVGEDSDEDGGRLYFALRRNGTPLNPMPWLAAGPG